MLILSTVLFFQNFCLYLPYCVEICNIIEKLSSYFSTGECLIDIAVPVGEGIYRSNHGTSHPWCNGECAGSGSAKGWSSAIIPNILHGDCKFPISIVSSTSCYVL